MSLNPQPQTLEHALDPRWIAEGALWFEPRMHFFILHLQGMSDSNILVTSRDQDKGGAHVYCVNTDELMNLDLRKRREC